MRLRICCLAALIAGPGCIDEMESESSARTATSAQTGFSFCSIPIENRDKGARARLFNDETFGGNGRTCATCHPADGAFQLTREAVQARFDANPQDPLFLQDGSDDGRGNGVTRILSDATIRITRRLPDYMSIADTAANRARGLDPSARSVVLPRATPSLFNVGVESVLPSPTFMLDGRNADLEDQALEAVRDHYEPEHEPSPGQRQQIATFQTSAGFFSSHELADFACGGPDPGLPEGTTDSERRGRRFFVPRPQPAPGSGEPEIFNCSNCHAGPLLNEVRFSTASPIVPDGFRFFDTFVSTFRARPERLIDFEVEGTDGVVRTVTTADPGRLLVERDADGEDGPLLGFRCGRCTTDPITGFATCGGCMLCSNFVPFNRALAGREDNVCGVSPGMFTGPSLVNATKIPSLRGISRTAPFFHDNSAQTLEEVVEHYVDFFEFHFRRTCTEADSSGVCLEARLDGRLSEQDVEDIIAFMKLL